MVTFSSAVQHRDLLLTNLQTSHHIHWDETLTTNHCTTFFFPTNRKIIWWPEVKIDVFRKFFNSAPSNWTFHQKLVTSKCFHWNYNLENKPQWNHITAKNHKVTFRPAVQHTGDPLLNNFLTSHQAQVKTSPTEAMIPLPGYNVKSSNHV